MGVRTTNLLLSSLTEALGSGNSVTSGTTRLDISQIKVNVTVNQGTAILLLAHFNGFRSVASDTFHATIKMTRPDGTTADLGDAFIGAGGTPSSQYDDVSLLTIQSVEQTGTYTFTLQIYRSAGTGTMTENGTACNLVVGTFDRLGSP